jgi:hypothetical protein
MDAMDATADELSSEAGQVGFTPILMPTVPNSPSRIASVRLIVSSQ